MSSISTSGRRLGSPVNASRRCPRCPARWLGASQVAVHPLSTSSSIGPSSSDVMERAARSERSRYRDESTIHWAASQTRPLLMIPGPTELPHPVVEAMSQPAAIQYDSSFDDGVLEPTMSALREIFQTRHEVVLLPGSGRTALEAAATSVIEPGDRVLVVTAGVFGRLMREIIARVGGSISEFAVEPGQELDYDRLAEEAARIRPKAITLVHNETSTGATYKAGVVGDIAGSVGALFILDAVSSLGGIEVRTDDWNVDLCVTGSQKCLAAPLGMAIVSVSDHAWHVMASRRRQPSSYVYDLLRWQQLWVPAARGGGVRDGAPRLQPISIPTHLTAALRV